MAFSRSMLVNMGTNFFLLVHHNREYCLCAKTLIDLHLCAWDLFYVLSNGSERPRREKARIIFLCNRIISCELCHCGQRYCIRWHFVWNRHQANEHLYSAAILQSSNRNSFITPRNLDKGSAEQIYYFQSWLSKKIALETDTVYLYQRENTQSICPSRLEITANVQATVRSEPVS